MSTPQAHVDKVKAMVEVISALSSVNGAWINDYGRFSNFDVWVEKKKVVKDGKLRNGSYKPAIAAIKRFCKANGMIYRGHFLPHPKDYHQSLHVDIDFFPYNAETNRFAEG